MVSSNKQESAIQRLNLSVLRTEIHNKDTGESTMKITVCELPNNWTDNDLRWNLLIDHLKKKDSDLLILPEMPFFKWLTRSDQVEPEKWEDAVKAHDLWIEKLQELPVSTILSSRPVIEKNKRLNRGFIWTRDKGYIPVHDKYYLPDEPGYYEASWYQRGHENFNTININGINIGFLICTELWFTTRAREYLKQDIHLLACPRATPESTIDKWLIGGQAAAIVSGAYCVSSNFNGPNTSDENFGGTGWIIDPEKGEFLGTTSKDKIFLTLEIYPEKANEAKKTYPRYVKD